MEELIAIATAIVDLLIKEFFNPGFLSFEFLI